MPFPFVVRGHELPAGHYEVRTEAGVLEIRNQDHGSGSFALTLNAEGRDPAGDQPSLMFLLYENEYLLSQVWESGRGARDP